MGNNGDIGKKFDIRRNPLAYILRGFNDIWTAGARGWQNHANSNGPEDFARARIVNRDVWRANIRYVMNVTRARSDEAAVRAWLDDVRSKNYSVLDGLGPLTELYVQATGAYTSIPPATVSDITKNPHYDSGHDDGEEFAGRGSSVLGAVVMLAKAMRYTIGSATHGGGGAGESRTFVGMDAAISDDAARYLQTLSYSIPSSTSGAKYIFASPRPWRMTPEGTLKFLGPEPHLCVTPDGQQNMLVFDSYESDVKVVPGLLCARKTRSDIVPNTTDDRGRDGGFPSGHTNAAYLEAIALAYAIPQRFQEMLMRAGQFGENRIVAGMHSPVDVIGGRISATAIAAYALNRPNVHALAQTAHREAQSYFSAMAKQSGQGLYAFAHREIPHPVPVAENGIVSVQVRNNNLYADSDAGKRLYRARMTYGLPKTGKSEAVATVPEGAEVLLETRLPYLNAAQRRSVLATTEISSGYPVVEGSNGWGRMDLVRAADGFGAFPTDIVIDMDAAKGGFNAADIWRNDISGTGGLTKTGTGKLTLSGNNGYSGKTVLENGTLAAGSQHAFGKGGLDVKGGTLQITADAPVIVGDCALEGGTLLLKYGRGTVRDKRIVVLQAKSISGRFAHAVANGKKLRLEYRSDRIIAVID